MSSRISSWLTISLLGAALCLGCAAASAPMAAPTVKAGSMARFIVHQGFLYALDHSTLLVYEAIPAALPQRVAELSVPAEAETLFPYGELLFVGTRQGMLVYSLQDPKQPELIGQARHIYSCDPVVVENDIAYVTLRAGSLCRRGVNALLVFDVSDPTKPQELKRYPMASPRGLGVDGNILFVADAKDGLLVLDVREPTDPRLLGKVPDVTGYDVIAHAGILYVSADDGLYQYEYGPEGISRRLPLSRIPIGEAAAFEPLQRPAPLQRAVDPDQAQ